MNAAGVFYLPLATGSYTGVKITVASTDDSFSSMVNYGDLDVARAGVTAIPLYKTSDGTSLYAMRTPRFGQMHVDMGNRG